MHTTTGQHRSAALWKRRGCALAVLGSLAGCGGGDASSLLGAAVLTSGTTQAAPLAVSTGQAVDPPVGQATATQALGQTDPAAGTASGAETTFPGGH